MGQLKKIFAGANTPDGFIGFYDTIVDDYDLEKFYILKGGSGVGKSTFIKKFAMAFPDSDKIFLICSGDPNSLDGVILPAEKIGIIDGTAPHMVDPTYPGVVDGIINLGEYITEVSGDKQTLQKLYARKKECYIRAYENLHKAREIHYKIESMYKNAVDFGKVNEKLEAVLDELKP